MARYIMAGRLQAFSFVALFAILALIIPPLNVFSNAAVALVTLRLGWRQGLALSFAGAFALGVLILLVQGSPMAGFQLGLIQFLPVVLIATVLLNTVSWTKTLQAVFLLCAAGILVFHAIVGDTAGFWAEVLEKSIKPILDASPDAEIDGDKFIATVSPWMTGLAAASMALILIVSLLVGRHWQAQLYNPGGFGEEFREIRLGRIAAIIATLVLLISVVTHQKIAIEILMVVSAVFLFQGLSLIHALVKQFEVHPIALFALYLMLLIVPHIAALLAAFGIVDGFADLRAKLIKNK